MFRISFARAGAFASLRQASPATCRKGRPEWLRPYWEWEFFSSHSANWWRRHWSKTGLVEVELVDNLADGWRLWAEWNECCAEVSAGPAGGSVAARAAEMLRLDGGQIFAFVRAVAQRAGG
jgi:hypothetical protein